MTEGSRRSRTGPRVGHGYDSHRFGSEGPLRLAGVEFPGERGLVGHSDGDAVAHAVTDALLGAAGAGSIGEHFPPGDPRWKGADSMGLLARVVEMVRGQGYRVGNVDVTVIAERPRILPRSREMALSLERVLDAPAGSVSVKGKTNEGMGWVGSGEGLAVHAVALLEPVAGAD